VRWNTWKNMKIHPHPRIFSGKIYVAWGHLKLINFKFYGDRSKTPYFRARNSKFKYHFFMLFWSMITDVTNCWSRQIIFFCNSITNTNSQKCKNINILTIDFLWKIDNQNSIIVIKRHFWCRAVAKVMWIFKWNFFSQHYWIWRIKKC
jgi:hypothetical protein